MWYWGGGVHWWGWLLGGVAMLAFWGLIVWAIWYFVTSVTRRDDRGDRRPLGGSGEPPADPLRILDERLARGEIDAEEYTNLRKLIVERDHTTVGSGRHP